MEIVRGMENLGPAKPCAVTIGTFDGVHKGHLQIIDTLLNEAAQKNCAPRSLHSIRIRDG